MSSKVVFTCENCGGVIPNGMISKRGRHAGEYPEFHYVDFPGIGGRKVLVEFRLSMNDKHILCPKCLSSLLRKAAREVEDYFSVDTRDAVCPI